MNDLSKYKEVAGLVSELVKILQNEKAGAKPYFPNYRTSISSNGSAVYNFEVSDTKVWKLKKIKIGCEPDVCYVTIWIDGLGVVVPRQLIRENNNTIEMPTDVFVRERVRVKIENSTATSQDISITLYITEYEKKFIDDLARELL